MQFPRLRFVFLTIFLAGLIVAGGAEANPAVPPLTTDNSVKLFEERQEQLAEICKDPSRIASEKAAATHSCNDLHPTIYYTPIVKAADSSCHGGEKHITLRPDGAFRCTKNAATDKVVNEEGAAVIVDRDGVPIQILKKAGKGLVAENIPAANARACPQGIGGVSNGQTVCLNPFRMVATGPGHKKGEVMFVPKSFCMRYPLFPDQPKENWAYHDGYWIVGDSFGSPKRNSRADFFSGSVGSVAANNPLMRTGLGDEHVTQQFCKVGPEKTAAILKENGFPKELPEHVQAAYRDNSLLKGQDPLLRATPAQVSELPARPQPNGTTVN